jgi:hypothetical protein
MDRPSVLHWYGKALLDRDAQSDGRAEGMLTQALAGYRDYGMPIHQAMVEELLSGRRSRVDDATPR